MQVEGKTSQHFQEFDLHAIAFSFPAEIFVTVKLVV